jgi:hypothetical protein
MNGFNMNFSLDFLDHWYFREIFKSNKFIYVLNSTIYQSLSVSGNAGACTVVLGAGATVIVVNFNVTYASAPVVIPSYEGANITIQTAPTTTEVTFTLSAASTSGDILRFITIE